MKSISVEQMRELDHMAIETAGIPGRRLMLRAGLGVAECAVEFLSHIADRHRRRIVVLCGKGSNGGDGYVIAQSLYDDHGYRVQVYSVCPKDELNGDASFYAEQLTSDISFDVIQELDVSCFEKGDLIIDALLGTGANGPLRPPYDNWISTVNSLALPVISVDIPSGLNGNKGTVEPVAVKADMTVTIAQPKNGMFLEQGPELCGLLRCVDIGIPQKYVDAEKSTLDILFDYDIRQFLPRQPMSSHKGTNGHVLVIGGSKKYRGAPLLTGGASLCSGAGLVFVAVPQSSQIGPGDIHSLIVQDVADSGHGTFSDESVPTLLDMAQKADSVAVGPGMTDDCRSLAVIKYLMQLDKPVVFDADALNLIARNKFIFSREAPTVLTPHPGEMKRLLESFRLKQLISSSRVDQARALADVTGTVIVLKGHHSVIASPLGELSINSSGSPALATAGSGDVLAGIIAAFLARGINAFDSAKAGVFIHGLAGELSMNGQRGLIADDLLGLIPQAMRQISPFS